jgi:hypothetical protein
MAEAKAEVKELIQDFVLINYDIPATEKKLRREFLKKAAQMGAEQYTESVYLLPFSEKALEMANELESAGHAVVWSAHQHNVETAVKINVKYEQGIIDRCEAISQRLVIVQDYINKGWLRRAQKMGIKTGKLLSELVKINENYKPGWLQPKIKELLEKWKEVHQ